VQDWSVQYDAVVLAGGASSRFGGVDKALLVLDGMSLLDRVLTATAAAETTVVVGPMRTTYREVTWTAEDPPAGGPVAGLAAGLAYGSAAVVMVASCDLPWITEVDVATLVRGLGHHDGFGLRDTAGEEQQLAAAYRRTGLAAAIEQVGGPRHSSVRRAIAGLDLIWTEPRRAGNDVDTWSDLDD
jgi:molybdopterin-guanine dinucleotide biosynthesis protein A